MHREGYTIVFGLVIAALILTLAYRLTDGGVWLRAGSVVLWLLAAFSAFFFRDPERQTPAGEGKVIAPADGRVIAIEEIEESEFFHGKTKRISIFLSVFNVHVNRAPVSGEVKLMQYQPGRFHVASLPEASVENEQSIIGVDSPWGKVLFKQIAGLIARRIVCDLREGHRVQSGERFGIIKFGSRMEVYLPLSAEVKVRLREKVRAGESILGELKNAK